MSIQRVIGFIFMLLLLRWAVAISGISPYPENAEQVISFASTLSEHSFSIEDAIRRFGTLDPDNRDDEISLHDLGKLITPFPTYKDSIKRVTLNTFEGKIDSVMINYKKPIQVSYERLRKEYGDPKYAPGPRCESCPSAIGYIFTFTPDVSSDKQAGVFVILELKDMKMPEKPSMLAVQSIRFQRKFDF